MKSILYILILTIVFTACSTQNALTSFKLTKKEQQSILNFQNVKIISKNKIKGIFSAIYLNEIDFNEYNEYENFYVCIYMKNTKDNLDFFLNSKTPTYIEELDVNNKFSNLSAIKNKWHKYYLLRFSKIDEDLKLKLIVNNKDSVDLTYKNRDY